MYPRDSLSKPFIPELRYRSYTQHHVSQTHRDQSPTDCRLPTLILAIKHRATTVNATMTVCTRKSLFPELRNSSYTKYAVLQTHWMRNHQTATLVLPTGPMTIVDATMTLCMHGTWQCVQQSCTCSCSSLCTAIMKLQIVRMADRNACQAEGCASMMLGLQECALQCSIVHSVTGCHCGVTCFLEGSVLYCSV